MFAAARPFVKKITFKKGIDFLIKIIIIISVKREIEVGGWFSKKILRKVEITS